MDISNEMHVALNSSSIGIVIADNSLRDMPLIFANPAFTIMTGYERNEIVGQNCRFLQGKDTDKDTVAQLSDCIKNRRMFEGKLLNYRKDGSKFWNKLTVNPVFNAAGKVTSFIGIQEDVTKEVIREIEKDKLISELQSTPNLVGYYSASAKRGIMEFLKLYIHEKAQNKPSKDVDSFLDHIFTTCATASEIIDNTLKFTRGMHHSIEKEIVDLNEIAYKAVEGFQEEIGKSGATVYIEDLPEAIGHHKQFHKVFENIIDNALKYREPNRKCEIHISARPSEYEALVDIKDNGVGIPHEEIETVFLAYKRSQKAKSRLGEGIGLATAKRIMESYNGEIDVSSQETIGSTFSLKFPKMTSGHSRGLS